MLLRLGDEVEMGNSVFRVDLVVPNPLEDDETTTAIDDDEIAMLKDEDMGVPMPNHEVHDIEDDDDDEDQHLDVDDQVEDAHLPVDEAEDDEADSDDHVIPLSVTSTRFAYRGPEQRRRERASERGREWGGAVYPRGDLVARTHSSCASLEDENARAFSPRWARSTG